MATEAMTVERVWVEMDKTSILENMMEQYGNAVLHLCCLYLKDHASAEDAAQETFLKAFEKWDSLKDETRFKPWLFQIAVNTCKNHLKSGWHKKVELALPPEQAGAQGPDTEVLRREESRQLLTAVSELKPKYKDVILLYYFQDFKTVEIAEILKLNPATVRMRLSRGKQQLKTQLREVDFHD